MATHEYTPLSVRFDSNVHLTIHQAFLASAGVLLSDPVARVHVVTVKTTRSRPSAASSSSPAFSTAKANAANDGVRVVLNSREVGKTKPSFFTAHPVFDESFDFTVAETTALTSLAGPASADGSGGAAFAAAGERNRSEDRGGVSSVVDYVVVTMESADGTAFYGEAYAPFSPHCASAVPAAAPVRVMLAPRNAQDAADPLFLQDTALLDEKHLDDFGFVTISWEVVVVPRGGAVLGGGESDTGAAPFPVGLTLRATWLARAAAYLRGAHYATSVEFGGADRFLFSDPQQPLCLTLQGGGSAESQLRRAVFHCSAQSVVEPAKSVDVAVPLPLPPLSSAAARDRDVHWVAPVRTAQGGDLGLLLVSMRVSSTPLSSDAARCPDDTCPRINDPRHQEQQQHVAQLYGASEPPQVPVGAYQPIAWESAQHVAEAGQRRWKRQCVVEARPTLDHVRHLFDVLMGRSTLDAGVAHVAAAFANKSPAEVTAGDLRELMVAFAFHAARLTVQEAARFCFVALRRDVADAVAAEEVQYIVDHCLLAKTVEMPAGERRRWVTDLFAGVPAVSYSDYVRYFQHNYAMWAAFGVPLTVEVATSSAQHTHAALQQRQQQQQQSAAHAALAPAEGGRGGGAVVDIAMLPAPAVPRAASAGRKSAGPAPISKASPSPATTGGGGLAAASAQVWRTFVVRVAHAPAKAFSVTAHVDDKISDVMAMVEETAGIAVGRQEWRLASSRSATASPLPSAGGGSYGASASAATAAAAAPPASSMKLVDPSALLGSTTLGLPSALRHTGSSNGAAGAYSGGNAQEVWIFEAEESLTLRFRVKDRLHGKKEWQERLPAKEKVLKVRAAVQRKTLIPLSRCILTVRHEDSSTTTLQDRHTLAHYHLVSGDVIEVTHDA